MPKRRADWHTSHDSDNGSEEPEAYTLEWQHQPALDEPAGGLCICHVLLRVMSMYRMVYMI